MSIRGFFQALFRPRTSAAPGPPPTDDTLAEEIRETLGPQAAGGLGGRMSGSAVYHLLEDKADRQPPSDSE